MEISKEKHSTTAARSILTMKITKNVAFSIGLVGFVLIAFLDVITTYRVSFLLLHLLPILFLTWYAGAAWGVFLSLAMSAVHILTSLHDGTGSPASFIWYMDEASDLAAALLLVWMQSRMRNAFDKVDRLARHDMLTACLNRTGFYEALQAEIDRAKRYAARFSLIYFDCDNFKFVNDSLGHHIGDDLLVKVGSTLRSHVRKVDQVGRLGGDEFAVLLPQAEQDSARKAIQHLQRQLDSEMQAMKWPVTFSMGVATFDVAPESIDMALELADGLMYEVKKNGKNAIVFRSY